MASTLCCRDSIRAAIPRNRHCLGTHCSCGLRLAGKSPTTKRYSQQVLDALSRRGLVVAAFGTQHVQTLHRLYLGNDIGLVVWILARHESRIERDVLTYPQPSDSRSLLLPGFQYSSSPWG